jgi:Mlc titration factor MtfA (ptsG expression regulator)
MEIQSWSRAFNAAYERLCREVARGRPTALDPYAAESPGEFFAVISEAFFATPDRVAEAWPAVYEQLSAFYRQDPLIRFQLIGRLPAATDRPDRSPECG